MERFSCKKKLLFLILFSVATARMHDIIFTLSRYVSRSTENLSLIKLFLIYRHSQLSHGPPYLRQLE